MSGSTIGGVLGGVVGFFFGNPQLGWMIGSAIGGYVDPEQISQFGPRLTDASQQTARDGIPIPYGYGTFPCHGNLIWCSDITEHVNESTEDGKGSGQEVTTTTYTYTRSYAIGICQGEIAGLLQIKRNGKVVWDTRTDEEFEFIFNPDGVNSLWDVVRQYIAQARAFTSRFSTKLAIYTGSNTQTADPTMEAHFGVGNVTAYRGLAYIVVTDDDVTELRGAVPQYEFVVRVNGTSSQNTLDGANQFIAATNDGIITAGQIGFSQNGTTWDEPVGSGIASFFAYGGGTLLKFLAQDSYASADRGATFGAAVAIGGTPQTRPYYSGAKFFVPTGSLYASTAGASWSNLGAVTSSGSVNAVGGKSGLIVVGSNDGHASYSTDGGTVFSTPSVQVTAPGFPSGPPITAISDGGPVVVVGDGDGNLWWTTDGITYTACTGDPFTNDVLRIHYDAIAGVYVALGRDGNTAFSGDGKAWALSTTSGLNGVDVDSLRGLFVMVANPSAGVRKIHTSTDGDVWVERSNVFTLYPFVAIAAMPICSEVGYELPDSPGVFVYHDGTFCSALTFQQIAAGTVLLSDIVAAEFQRVGLTSDDYDVSQLTDEVLGYRVLPNGSGVDASLGPLMQGHFFDIAEWDGKLRCIKRGGASSLALTMDDLAERDGDAIEWTRVQEAELLRLQTVAYIDPAAGYSPTTQKWERRAGTVQARGEAAVEVPITAEADTASTIATIRGLIAWAEPEKAKFSLPYRFAAVTPTDILTLTDDNGAEHRLRVGQIEDDSGVRLLEVTKERGNVYDATAAGATPGTPNPPSGGGLVGPTIAHYMNLPSLRSSDNQPGFYAGVTGLLAGWQGADIYISADGGVSYQFAKRILSRATLGELAADCTASSEPITVTLFDNRSLSTITADQLAARQNAFAIGEEVGQFQTATENVDEDWELTDALRGQLSTVAASHAAGAEWSLLDGAVQLVPVDVAHAGVTLKVKAVSIGTSLDDTDAVDFVFDPPTFIRDGGVVAP